MKRLNILAALLALDGAGTKEDIIIQVAKQQNIRFNDLPQLQKEVDQALEESHRLGFIQRQGAAYRLTSVPCRINNKVKKEASQLGNDAQGDCKRGQPNAGIKLTTACLSYSSVEDALNVQNSLDKHVHSKDKSVCLGCGHNSENRLILCDQETDSNWVSASSLVCHLGSL